MRLYFDEEKQGPGGEGSLVDGGLAGEPPTTFEVEPEEGRAWGETDIGKERKSFWEEVANMN